MTGRTDFKLPPSTLFDVSVAFLGPVAQAPLQDLPHSSRQSPFSSVRGHVEFRSTAPVSPLLLCLLRKTQVLKLCKRDREGKVKCGVGFERREVTLSG